MLTLISFYEVPYSYDPELCSQLFQDMNKVIKVIEVYVIFKALSLLRSIQLNF
jgi:hypothetical protein